jgi:hypothetical protein
LQWHHNGWCIWKTNPLFQFYLKNRLWFYGRWVVVAAHQRSTQTNIHDFDTQMLMSICHGSGCAFCKNFISSLFFWSLKNIEDVHIII